MKTKVGLQLLEDNEIEWMLSLSFTDNLKAVLSSLLFQLGVGLLGVIYFLLQATSFDALLSIPLIGAPLVFIYADSTCSWLRGWSPSWIVLAVLRRNDKKFVVAMDRIGRKRIFMHGAIWTEVDGNIPNDRLKIALDEVIRHSEQYKTMPFRSQETITPFHQLDTKVHA